MNILEILLIFLSTLIFIPPVLFFSQMNKEIIKKKNMIGIIPQPEENTTEEKVLLVQSYEYLGLKEENSQKDFNQKIIEKTQEKVDKETGKGLSTNDYNDNDKNRVEALNSIFNEKNELILNEEKIQLSQPYVDLELTAEHTQKHFNQKIIEKTKEKVDKETGKGLSTNDYNNEDKNRVEALNSIFNEKNELILNEEKIQLLQPYLDLGLTAKHTQKHFNEKVVEEIKKLVGLFKYYPYSIVRSSKYVNFIESAKTKSDVFEFLNIGQKKELTVTDSNTFVVLCYKETKPDYTKNIIKLNIDKNNFSQRINNIAMFNYGIRGVVLTTDDVYNPESKHNVYISNSEEYTTEEFPKEIVIDVAGKQNYNIFYLVNVELSVNPGSFAGVGDFELTLNKGFLSY